jgi:hypothetical protein
MYSNTKVAIAKSNIVFVTLRYDRALNPKKDLLGINNLATTARITEITAITLDT